MVSRAAKAFNAEKSSVYHAGRGWHVTQLCCGASPSSSSEKHRLSLYSKWGERRSWDILFHLVAYTQGARALCPPCTCNSTQDRDVAYAALGTLPPHLTIGLTLTIHTIYLSLSSPPCPPVVPKSNLRLKQQISSLNSPTNKQTNKQKYSTPILQTWDRFVTCSGKVLIFHLCTWRPFNWFVCANTYPIFPNLKCSNLYGSAGEEKPRRDVQMSFCLAVRN